MIGSVFIWTSSISIDVPFLPDCRGERSPLLRRSRAFNQNSMTTFYHFQKINVMKKMMILALGLLLISLFNACQKETITAVPPAPTQHLEQSAMDASRQAFFFQHYSSNTLSLRSFDEDIEVDSAVSSVYNEIREVIAFQDAAESFIPQLNKDFGLPKWNSAVVTHDQVLWVIPFVYEDVELTTALLFIKHEQGTYDFKLVSRDEVLGELRSSTPGLNLAYSLVWLVNYDESLFQYTDPRFKAYLEEGFRNEEIEDRTICSYTYCVTVGSPGGGNDVNYVMRGCPSGAIPITVYYDCSGGSSTPGWGLTGTINTPNIFEDLGRSGWNRGGGSSTTDPNPTDWWEEVSYIRMILFDFGVEAFNELPIQVQTKLQQLYEWGEALELPPALQVELWYKCEDAGDFEMCARDVILEHYDVDLETILSTADEDWPGIIYSRTCKKSFNFIQTGDAYTAQVSDIRHAYHANGHVVDYTIGAMCIQVRGEDAFGNALTKEKAAELSAFAMDGARLRLLDEVGISITLSFEARNRFKKLLKEQLEELTGGRLTSTITLGTCLGDIEERPYSLSLFGFFACIKP